MTNQEISAAQTIDLEPVSQVRLRVVSGDVSITATDGPCRLEVHSLVGPPLHVHVESGALTLEHRDDVRSGGTFGWLIAGGRRQARREVSLALMVPSGCAVHITSVSADTVVSGVTGPTQVSTVSGEVTLDGLGGEVSARTVSGDVEALELNAALSFQTVSGDLTVAGGSSPKIIAKSVSGDVMLEVDIAPAGRVDVVTVSGDVVLRLPAETAGAQVAVTSMSGRLTCGLSGLVTTNLPGRQRLEGAFGDSSGVLRVKTVSGDVDLLCSAVS